MSKSVGLPAISPFELRSCQALAALNAGAASTAVGLEERSAQQAMRLLGDFLASASGAAMSANADDEAAGPGPAGSAQHSVARSPSRDGVAARGLDEPDGMPGFRAAMSPDDLAGLWTDAWTALLPQVCDWTQSHTQAWSGVGGHALPDLSQGYVDSCQCDSLLD